jgi:Holliday junction DNA helicase RuvA
MFEYILGTLRDASFTKAIVEANGLGYAINIAINTYNKLPKLGSEVKLYLSLSIREDAHLLYGFLSLEERDLFLSLCAVSGIGPKTALALTGHLEAADLYMAISQAQVSVLCKIPGVGKKTAERLVVELRDKVKVKNSVTTSIPKENSLASDATSALINLGYNPIHAQKAVRSALESKSNCTTLSELITSALRQI